MFELIHAVVQVAVATVQGAFPRNIVITDCEWSGGSVVFVVEHYQGGGGDVADAPGTAAPAA